MADIKQMRALYAERNLIAQAFAQAMEQLGWPVAWGTDLSEPDWPVLYIETPEGQVSWHIPRSECIYQPPDLGPVQWDGHTTETKIARLQEWLTKSDPLEASIASGITLEADGMPV